MISSDKKNQKEDLPELRTFKQRCEAILKIGNLAIRNAQKENTEMGLPNDYVIGNKHIYIMPDGKVKYKTLR